LRRILAHLAKVNESLCGAARNFAGLLLIAMLVIVIMQIVFRYVLNDSLIWTEELAKTMMVWTALLVAPWAYRAGANVRIEMFVNEMPPVVSKSLLLLLNLLVLWIVAVFLLESGGFWQRGLTVRADSLPIQVAWFYAVVPVAFSLLLLVCVEHLLRNVLALKYPGEDFEIAHLDDVFESE
jgi:TRAP-type C4-dicarboxylate transport system permease small subunit